MTAPEARHWSEPANACEVLVLAGDRDLAMLTALARAEARLVTAKLSGVGLAEAEEIREAAYLSAAILFGSAAQ